jgi:hypothetical protein
LISGLRSGSKQTGNAFGNVVEARAYKGRKSMKILMKRCFFSLSAVSLLVALSGCPMPQDATFVFTNTMTADESIPDNYMVTSIQFRGPTDKGFRPNELSDNATIEPGESMTFFLDTQGNPGDWMVKIQYNLYLVAVMTSLPAYLEINGVTEKQEYTWNWSVL